MTSFVSDASVGVTWLLQDRSTDETDAALERVFDHGACAPSVWPYDTAKSLLKSARRVRMPAEPSWFEMRFLFIVMKRVDVEIDAGGADVFSATMDIALRHTVSSYDAAYLELALRRRLPLATLDKALDRAARAEGVSLVL